VKHIKVIAVALLGLLPAVTAAQAQRLPREQRLGRLGGPPPRARLEAEIFDRFMNKVSRDLQLDAGARNRLERHVRETGQQRRQLAQQSVQLRRRLNQAVQDPTRSDAEIAGLLNELEQLRTRENELWKNDQNALGQMLTPRQRAVFTLQFMQLNDRIRDLVQQRQLPSDTSR
jgi:Spy/CpxP family protein refolding chaperone